MTDYIYSVYGEEVKFLDNVVTHIKPCLSAIACSRSVDIKVIDVAKWKEGKENKRKSAAMQTELNFIALLMKPTDSAGRRGSRQTKIEQSHAMRWMDAGVKDLRIA